MLIEKGLNVSVAEPRRHWTPLHYIAYYDFSRRGQEDWTEDDTLSNSLISFEFLLTGEWFKLHLLISHIIEFAQLFIDRGADVFAKAQYEGDEKIPFDLATSKKGTAVIVQL